MRTAIVTGSGGLVGSETVGVLVEAGFHVVGLGRPGPAARSCDVANAKREQDHAGFLALRWQAALGCSRSAR
jgi:NAD(P)-dependent dehydrogenase (short-subunit alcohol dehydrogenase family)